MRARSYEYGEGGARHGRGRSRAHALPGLAVLLLMLALAPAPGVRAQDVLEDGVLTVAEAYARALEGNPIYRDILLDSQDLRARRTSALGLEAPTVSYLREGLAGGLDAPGEERWTLSQELPSLPEVMKRRQGFSARLEAAGQSATAARRQLRARVKGAYAEVVYREKIIDLRRNQLELARRADDAVTLRLEMGEAARREKLQSRLNVVAASNDLQEANAAFDRARYGLFALIGLSPDEQEYGVLFSDTLSFDPVDFTQEESLEHLANQPRFLAARARLTAARADLSAESWSLFPALSVSVYKQNYDGQGFDNHGFEIGASLPLFFMPGHRGRVGQARAEVARSQWRQTSELLDMKREIEQAWHGYDASLAVLESLAGESLAQSRELLDLALEGYNAGEAGLIDLITAQQTNLESRLRFLAAIYDFNLRLITLENYLPGELITPVETQAFANEGEF